MRLDENPPRYELEGEEHRLQPETANGAELVALTRQAIHDHATGSYTGIWHDVRNNGRFYSVHDNGEQVVLINLPGIEQGHSVPQEAYLGDRAKLVLTRISPNNSPDDLLASVRLLPLSPTEMMVEAMCLGCGVNAIRLKKVF